MIYQRNTHQLPIYPPSSMAAMQSSSPSILPLPHSLSSNGVETMLYNSFWSLSAHLPFSPPFPFHPPPSLLIPPPPPPLPFLPPTHPPHSLPFHPLPHSPPFSPTHPLLSLLTHPPPPHSHAPTHPPPSHLGGGGGGGGGHCSPRSKFNFHPQELVE